MNNTFLEHCVSHIYSKHQGHLSDTAIVFPNKRAIIFFKQYLSAHITEPVFVPKCTTIQDLFIEHTRALVPENLVLVYLLYGVYIKHTGSSENFDLFFPWGEMLLRDFHDIDMYRIDAQLLFKNISQIKDYERTFDFLTEEQIAHISRFWNVLSVESSSDSKKKFIEVWNVLGDIYSEYTDLLRKNNFAYHGMAARDCIELCKTDGVFGDPHIHYCFVGFNALTACEIALFDFLQSAKRASFYWDYDVMYTKCGYEHEAGYFIKKHLQKFPNELDETLFNSFAQQKNIAIISVPQPVTQVKLCADWISQQNLSSESSTNAAIILADESIITPMLTSIPEHVQYNVSLGYPVTATHAYALCLALLHLQSHAKGNAVYYKDVFQICENPLIPYEKSLVYNAFRSEIADKNYLYIARSQWEGKSEFMPYFELVTSPVECIAYMERCILYTAEHGAANEVEKSVLYMVYTELQQLSYMLSTYEITIDSISFIASLLTKAIVSKSIAIQGEPLHDLQIMGVLETRTLDFSHLMVLSVNEGVFPKTSVGSSFIPYSLRTGFGMPTIKEQTAIYSYYFYRLIQRAQDITLVYSTNVDSNGKGEMSRYIMQLLYEQSNPLHTITNSDLSFSLSGKTARTIVVEKTDDILDFFKLFRNGEKTLSPSAISCYLTCKLQFYFKYIRKLELQNQVQELPNEADYGNFFHYAMEELYKPFENKEVTKNDIQLLLDNAPLLTRCVEQNIHAVLRREKQLQSDSGGIEALALHTTLTYVNNTLRYDMARAPFFLCAVEKQVKFAIPLSNHQFYIGGIIDRYEIFKETHTIIDYKTGAPDYEVSSVSDLFDRTKTKINKAALQSLIYAYVISETEKVRANVLLYFIREIHTKTDPRIYIEKKPLQSFEEVRDDFVALLTDLLEDLCNPLEPFVQTENEEHCKYCDFKTICGKV